MSKGDWRRPSSVPKSEYDANFEAVFGVKKLNVMSDTEREEMNRDRDRAAGGEVPQDGHDSRNLHAES